MRITRPEMFMMMAEAAAKRSTCFRLNVGAIIVHRNNVLSIGYNGQPPGATHCTGNSCPGKDGCKLTIHAEENAIRRAIEIPWGSDLYVTDSPCKSCADLMIKHEIKRVFFKTPYRVIEPVQALIKLGVKVYQVTPAGYIIDWETREFADIA